MTDSPELARWNQRFSAPEYHFGTEPNAFLAAQRHRLQPGMTALSIADGEGRNGVWLARQGLRVTGFDFAPAGLEKARRLARDNGVTVEYVLSDLEAWDWDARQFDVIVGIFIQFTTPPQRAKLFAGICRALRPNGLVILQGYTPEQLNYGTGGPKNADQLYTAAMLKEGFAGLEILELREHVSEVQEGHGHAGKSALIDFVARRPG